MKNVNTKEQELLVSIIRVRELEEQYGHISCFDAPKAYEQMGEIQEKVRKLANDLSQEIEGVSAEGLYKVYEDIAKDARTIYHIDPEDIVEAMEEGIIEFNIYDIHEFMDLYVLHEEKNELFSELFWFADINTRVEYLKDKFLCDLDIYYSRFLDYLVLFKVDEEALESYQNVKNAA